MMNEKEFVSLDIPDIASQSNTASSQLDFLPSNYDYNNQKSSDNSENNSTINFGETGLLFINYFC
jgi:hypothetical protein